MGSSGGGGKGGGGGSNAHDYFGTIAGAGCTGPVEGLVQLICDGKEVWPKAKGWKSGDAIALNELRSAGGKTWKSKSAHLASAVNKPPNPTYWLEYYLAAGATNFADLTVEGYGTA